MITRLLVALLLLSFLSLHEAHGQHDSVYVYKKRHLVTVDMAAETAGKPFFFLGFGYSISPVRTKQYHVGMRVLLYPSSNESGLGFHDETKASIVDLTNRFFLKRPRRTAPMVIFNIGVRHFHQNVYRIDKYNLNPVTAIATFPLSLFGARTRTDLFSSRTQGVTAAIGYGAVVNLGRGYVLYSVDLRTSPTFERYEKRDRANLMLSFNIGLGI